MPRIAIVYGTRPEAIKVAPLIHESQRHTDLDTLVVSTGQHRDMLHPVETLFGFAPEARLETMHPGQSLTELFSRVAGGLDGVFAEHRPDLVVVHGDTTTAAAAALTAYHREIPVAHLEAGLRSGHFWRPFPEEGNRRLITRMSQLHLAPTQRAEQNLLAEHVPAHEIVVTGNTVIDALQWAAQRTAQHPWPAALAHLDELRPSTRLVLVTLHRRENQAAAIAEISAALAQFAGSRRDMYLVFPMHRNPAVREVVRENLTGLANVSLVEPVDYLTLVKLLQRSWLVVTDSGGLQEEAPAFGVPVLVARDNTERPEAVEAGTARLVGGDGATLLARLRELAETPEAWASMAGAINPFGDGRASVRAMQAVRARLGLSSPLSGPPTEPLSGPPTEPPTAPLSEPPPEPPRAPFEQPTAQREQPRPGLATLGV